MPGGHIVVIGAGVIGLTAAYRLSQAGYDITIVAQELPGDLAINYASPWAGAHFRPMPITNEREAFEQGLARESYVEYASIAAADVSAGIEFIPGIEYLDAPPRSYTDLSPAAGYSSWPEFRVLRQDELPGGGHGSIKWGARYRSWAVNTPVYLQWLMRQLLLRGTKVIRHTLSSTVEAVFVVAKQNGSGAPIKAVVNCSGMGFDDVDTFPSRGQILMVANPVDRTVTHQAANGDWTFVIPRPLNGGTIVGGTKELGNWNPYASEKTTSELLERIVKIYPQLLTPSHPTLKLLTPVVGRRPMRNGGLRIEREVLPIAGFEGVLPQREIAVVHCYGAGGMGYELSWGAAKRVEDLILAAESGKEADVKAKL